MQIETRIESWPLARPFRITGHVFNEVSVVVVELRKGELVGRGEACGAYYKGETPASMAAQIEAVAAQLNGRDFDRQTLDGLLSAGGARNALDCALWDIEAKCKKLPVWRLAGLEAPKPLLTTYTLGGDHPDVMADAAIGFSSARALKLKLVGDGLDADRVKAVRSVRPDTWLGVDANQAFTRQELEALLPTLVDTRVALVEQPLPIGREADLDGFASPIPIAADESAQDVQDVAHLVGRFDVVNIKLDKCGGLTRALQMSREARRQGLKVMVGNMGGTSLSMGPAFLVGQECDVVDLDGPILLKTDRVPAAVYEDGCIWCPEAVWGAADDMMKAGALQ